MLDPIKDVVRLSGLPDPVLHLLLGLAIYLVVGMIIRHPLRSWVPWLITLGLQLLNEAADIAGDLLAGEIFRWRGGLIDTAVTMALPTIILLASRYLRRRSPPPGGIG